MFFRGFFAPIRAIKLILSSKKLMSLSLVPLIINIALYIAFFYYGTEFIQTYSFKLLTSHTATWPAWAQSVASFGIRLASWVLLTLVAVVIFTFVSTIVAAPFNDAIAKQTLKLIEVREFEIQSTIAQTMRLEVKRTIVLLLGGITALFLGIIPFLQLPALALGALLVSFEFFGYPLAQKTKSLRNVWRFTFNNFLVSLGFGSFLLLMMAIPFASIVYIPLAVVGASILVAETLTKH